MECEKLDIANIIELQRIRELLVEHPDLLALFEILMVIVNNKIQEEDKQSTQYIMDDPTGYTQRKAERNNLLLQEILGDIRAIKREVVLIKQKQIDINKKWEIISKKELPETQPAKGWIWS